MISKLFAKSEDVTTTKIKYTAGERVFLGFIYIFLILLNIAFLYPLFQTAVISISNPREVLATNGLMLLPRGIHLDGYRVAFSNPNLWSGVYNTFFYVIFGTLFIMLITVLAGYTLSLRDAMLKKPIMIYLTITMYFSGGLIPFFLLISQLGLLNSRLVLIIPYGVNVWNIIIMRTQFRNLPDELKDAAIIDGANDFRMLFQIFIPLSKAVLAVLILFSVVSYWNMWFEPMIFLNDRSLYPLQSILREILIDVNERVMAGAQGGPGARIDRTLMGNIGFRRVVQSAFIMISTLPILFVYPFAQRFFVKGVMVGSLKG